MNNTFIVVEGKQSLTTTSSRQICLFIFAAKLAWGCMITLIDCTHMNARCSGSKPGSFRSESTAWGKG
eukprot:5527563-Pleurochrysis_carterae.AAC.2